MLHALPAANCAGQSCISANSPDELAMEETSSGALPLLLRMASLVDEVVPKVTRPKPSATGARLTDGAGVAMASPASETDAVPEGVFEATSSVATLVPSALGFSATVIVQVPPGATAEPALQLPPTTMSPACGPLTE